MGNQSKKIISKIIGLSLVMLLGACAKQKPKSSGDTKSRDTRSQTAASISVRYCDPAVSPITNSSPSELSNFFGEFVSELEGAPSFCHKVVRMGSTVDLYFMVEYEDRQGIRSVKFSPENIVSRRLSEDTNDINKYVLDIIFKDDYGLVRVNAIGPKNTGVLSGHIYYYNFAPYKEALDAAIQNIEQLCQNGSKTTYECWGYTYPTHWGNQPTPSTVGQLVKEMATAIMNDVNKSRSLGAITLDIGENTFPE
jgi:hypothetical protein